MRLQPLPSSRIRYYAGLDVHRDTISACIYDGDRRRICFESEFSTHKLKKLSNFVEHVHGNYGEFRSCYEASSCGYVLYHQLRELGVDCAVIAPGSVPRRPGDRIKTDIRDSRRLAEYFAAGLLTECFVPDRQFEAARGLVRSRDGLVKIVHPTKMRVIHLLQARGQTYNAGKDWTKKFMAWLNHVNLEELNDERALRSRLAEINFMESQIREVEQQIGETAELPRFQESVRTLQGFRGIGLITAMQLVCEIGDFTRFSGPTALMAYLGLVPSQHSSGNSIRHGSITKTGNRHARKALVSAAWKYTHCPRVSVALRERQKHCSARTVEISQRAQKRLYKRYQALIQRKSPKVAIVAIARELTGFLWDAMQPVPMQ